MTTDHRPFDPSASPSPILAQALARLLSALGPNPLAHTVGQQAGALIERLDAALPHQVFATADAVRDALAASIPALRNEHGLNLIAQQSLMREALTVFPEWSHAHQQAWRRGVMNPSERQAAAAYLAQKNGSTDDDAWPQDPDLFMPMVLEEIPGADECGADQGYFALDEPVAEPTTNGPKDDSLVMVCPGEDGDEDDWPGTVRCLHRLMTRFSMTTRFGMSVSLDAVQDSVLAVIDRPVASPGDLRAALARFGATTATWSEPWFTLAWHALLRMLPPSFHVHLLPPGAAPSDVPVALLLAARLREAYPALPDTGMPREALRMTHPEVLSTGDILRLRANDAPLKDPEAEDAALVDAQRQDDQAQRARMLVVMQDKAREFRNSAAYEPLHKGVALRPVSVDVERWQDGLDAAFPWMRPLTARLARRLAIQRQNGLPLQLPNLALLGDPGVGKTWYWRTALNALNHPLSVLTLSGSNDSMAIKGTTAGWATERPGIAAHTMAIEQCANPVILLDEIDKAGGGDNNGRAVDALLPLLEASTADAYRDDCLQQEIDASRISWVLTLNDEEKLNAALRSRVEVITVTGPDWSNPVHVDAALTMGENLAWKPWGEALRTPTTGLSVAQKDALRRTRWKSLRSLGQAIAGQLEENLYAVTVEARLTPGQLRAESCPTELPSSWRPTGEAL